MTEREPGSGELGKEGLRGVTSDGDGKGRCYSANSPRKQAARHLHSGRIEGSLGLRIGVKKAGLKRGKCGTEK